MSPFNLLDLYTYQDAAAGARAAHVRGARHRRRPSRSTRTPRVDGNVDPTPAVHTWTMTADTAPPGTEILSGPPAKIGEETPADFVFFGSDNFATPELGAHLRVLGGQPAVRAVRVARVGAGPAAGRAHLARAGDRPGGQRGPDAGDPQLDRRRGAGHEHHLGPAGRVLDGTPPQPPSTSENAVFVFGADQPGSTFECSLDGADFRRLHLAARRTGSSTTASTSSWSGRPTPRAWSRSRRPRTCGTSSSGRTQVAAEHAGHPGPALRGPEQRRHLQFTGATTGRLRPTSPSSAPSTGPRTTRAPRPSSSRT